MDAKTLSLAALESFDPNARAKGNERRFCCPLCHSDRKLDAAHRCLLANTQTGAWNCKRCSAKGLLTEFWTKQPNTTQQPRRQKLTAMPGSITAAPTTRPEQPVTDRGYDFKEITSHLKPIEGTAAAAYIEGRGIPLNLVKGAKLRYMPAVFSLHLRESVAFGLQGPKGETVALQLRNIEGSFKPIYKGKDSPYAFITPGAIEAPHPIITEAPIDALTLAACGFPAIATCGTSCPEWIIKALALKRVMLAQDADQAGDKAATKTAAMLREYGAMPERLRPNGVKDWNEYAQVYGIETLRAALIDAIGPTTAANLTTDAKADPFQEDTPDENASFRVVAAYVPHTAPVTDGRLFPDPPPHLIAQGLKQWNKSIEQNWAWQEWVSTYSKYPDAPQGSPTIEAITAYVARNHWEYLI